jgi:hypoxanthine phosphoribosyltransferase
MPRPGEPDRGVGPRFANATEAAFAAYLDRRGFAWEYEPRTFLLRQEGGRTREAFTPDVYLPALDRYVEITTLRQPLVTPKNRKLRRVRERYPGTDVRILYRRDCARLLGFDDRRAPSTAGMEPGEVLVDTAALRARVRALARRIDRDYDGRPLLLVGVLNGGVRFLSELLWRITVPFEYGLANPAGGLDHPAAGRHVLLVDDLVDTGLTLEGLRREALGHGALSVAACALVTREGPRLADCQPEYVGFTFDARPVAGFGIDHLGRFRELPRIVALKPAETETECSE